MAEPGNPESNFKKLTLKTGISLRAPKSRVELQVDNRKLAEMAKTDFLTGLPNRRQFEIDLRAAISNFERNGVPFTIINIDLIDFKSINENPEFRHPGGDKALQFFGSFLVQHIRALDRPSRLGGDEFAVILGETNQQEGEVIIQNLRESLEKTKEILGSEHKVEQLVNMRASAKQWSVSDTYSIFMHDLDQRMYEEERKGANDV